MRRAINGILLLDKPIGLTSNRALQTVKHLFQAKKAGHTGSLDPIATGMLPICFGEATKFSQYLLDSDKSYQVVAKLGERTNTADSEGEVIETKSSAHVTIEMVQQIIKNYLGPIQQIPPMYSALKHQGRPLYELARKGIEIERPARTVTIHSLTFDGLSGDQLTMSVHCSKGTYIRTLVDDIGRDLGCGAHVIALRRTSVSPYTEHAMYSLSELESVMASNGYTGLSQYLLPLETAVQFYPAVKLSTSAAFYLRTGQPVRTSLVMNAPLVRLLSEDARFLGMGEVTLDGRVKPHRLIAEVGGNLLV